MHLFNSSKSDPFRFMGKSFFSFFFILFLYLFSFTNKNKKKKYRIPPTINHIELEVQMEHAIRHMITSLRRNELRLGTEWDDQLSYMLGPALCQST